MQICIPNQMHSLHPFSCGNLDNALIRDLSCDLSLNTNAGPTLLHPLCSLLLQSVKLFFQKKKILL